MFPTVFSCPTIDSTPFPNFFDLRNEQAVLNQLLSWAHSDSNARAVVMTGSRTNPRASVDVFSDYDIELIVSHLNDFIKDENWAFKFGSVIADIKGRNSKSLTQLVLYSDGVRIDFQIYTVKEFYRRRNLSPLPEHWDIGYKVLLDKDEILETLPKPTHTLFNISQPTEKEYAELVKDFWWDTTYVAKSLWRDEIFYAKYMFDSLIRNRYLLKMLEWHIGSKNNWVINTNKKGRWFKQFMDKKTWKEVEKTFTDSSIEKNWASLFVTTRLFKRIATELSKQLNYKYDSDLEKNISGYLRKIQRLEKNAKDFSS